MINTYLRASLVALCCCVAVSCSPDEPLINSFDDQWRLLATSGGKDLTSTIVPSEQVSQINPNDVDFGAGPTMTRFRNNVYFTSSDRPWIIVYDADRLVYSDTIFTFNDLDGTSDICFANATTAYVTSPKSGCVGVIDLTTSNVARTIKTPGKPQQIACLGNQICVTIPDSQCVVIIDSRTNEIVHKMEVGEYPWYVREDPVANVFCVVSLGRGKTVASETPTTPTISFISPSTRELLKTLDLTVRASEGPRQFPRGLAITSSQFALVPVQSGLLRVSTRTRSRVSSVQSDSFDIVVYNDARAEVICQRLAGGSSPQVVVLDEDASEKKFTLTRSSRAAALLGVAR